MEEHGMPYKGELKTAAAKSVMLVFVYLCRLLFVIPLMFAIFLYIFAVVADGLISLPAKKCRKKGGLYERTHLA